MENKFSANQESIALTFNLSMGYNSKILGGLYPLAVVAKGLRII